MPDDEFSDRDLHRLVVLIQRSAKYRPVRLGSRLPELIPQAVRALARRGSFQSGRGKWHV
jgi:hypothetical protein